MKISNRGKNPLVWAEPHVTPLQAHPANLPGRLGLLQPIRCRVCWTHCHPLASTPNLPYYWLALLAFYSIHHSTPSSFISCLYSVNISAEALYLILPRTL